MLWGAAIKNQEEARCQRGEEVHSRWPYSARIGCFPHSHHLSPSILMVCLRMTATFLWHLPLLFHSESPLVVTLPRCLFGSSICWSSSSPWPGPIDKATHDHQANLDPAAHVRLESYSCTNVRHFSVRAAGSGCWDHRVLQLLVSLSQEIHLRGECLIQGQLLPSALLALGFRKWRLI